jgi:hypothetical protein
VIRYRGRLWASATPITNLSLNARVAAEPRLWTRPAFTGNFREKGEVPGQQGMEWRYGIVDNLYLRWNNIADAPLSVSIGRQDLTFGDFWNWWLVADGTPSDGSWTYFLDSARVTLEVKNIKTKFDAIYIYQNARPDEWIPTLNAHQSEPGDPRAYGLTEQNEQGVIFYASNKSIQNATLDGYFIYKRDDKEFANGDSGDIFTVGGRFTGLVADHVQYFAEGAYQFGEKTDAVWEPDSSGRETRDRDLSAFGVNARLSYLLRDKLNNQAHLIYEFLSGDDVNSTGRDEMFDVLWGRWPRWSELYIYSYAQETSGKVAQLNNIQRLGAGWTLSPIKNMTVGAYYNALFAPEDLPTRTVNPARFSGDGNFRGHYLQAVLSHTFSKHVKGHLWGECVWEGDYYHQRDLMSFLRAEITFTY